MEFLFDTVNLQEIKDYSKIIPISGVTSNPSIIKKEGKINLFSHFRQIREIIGFDKTLHIQVVSQDCEQMIREAELILKHVDEKVFIKVPVTKQGLRAIRLLKNGGVCVTATAIYSKIQGFLAIKAGADYIAPYFNRMQSLDIDAKETIEAFSKIILRENSATKILAASFKNSLQICDALLAGAEAATVSPLLLHEALSFAAVQKAVDNFSNDFSDTFHRKTMEELVESLQV